MKRETCNAHGRSEWRQVVDLMTQDGWTLESYVNHSAPYVNKPHFELIFIKEEEHEES